MHEPMQFQLCNKKIKFLRITEITENAHYMFYRIHKKSFYYYYGINKFECFAFHGLDKKIFL